MQFYDTKDYIMEQENIALIQHSTSKKETVHTHNFIEFEYIYRGRGLQMVNGVEYHVHRGDLLFINLGDTHAFEPEGELGVIDCVVNPAFFGEEFVSSENLMDVLRMQSFCGFDEEIRSSQVRFSGEKMLEFETLLRAMLREYTDKKIGYLTVLKGYMNILLVNVFREIADKDNAGIYRKMGKIAPEILEYIQSNYNKKLTLKEVAQKCFYNPTYFSKMFKECYHKTFTQYLNELRIQEAVKQLETTNRTVEKIGVEAGFDDKKQFYKVFKEYTGTTPKKYRDEKNKG